MKAAKEPKKKATDEELVHDYMAAMEHPLKAEIEAVRGIIKTADERISERIKWAAPSYYYKEDMVTFNHRNQKQVHLVFHHPTITQIRSTLLEGDYKDRRMMYLSDMQAVKTHEKELTRIMKELVQLVDNA